MKVDWDNREAIWGSSFVLLSDIRNWDTRIMPKKSFKWTVSLGFAKFFFKPDSDTRERILRSAMSCFSGCFTSLPGVRCDRWAWRPKSTNYRRRNLLTRFANIPGIILYFSRFDCIKSEGNIVAADQFFLSHVDCDNRVSIVKLEFKSSCRLLFV